MNREQEIRGIAYEIWIKEGRPTGHALEHWLRAEAVWNQKQSGSAIGTPQTATVQAQQKTSLRARR